MIALLIQELARQDEKWGQQNHPLIGPERHPDRPLHAEPFYSQSEEWWKRVNDDEAERGASGWDGILLEEVFEALAATETGDQITELVQVAAVAIQAAMALERAA